VELAKPSKVDCGGRPLHRCRSRRRQHDRRGLHGRLRRSPDEDSAPCRSDAVGENALAVSASCWPSSACSCSPLPCGSASWRWVLCWSG